MARRLSSVPDLERQPRRLLGLIRVSKERDEMISPENQEFKVRTWVQASGDLLVPAPNGEPFLYGIDESGSRAKSSWWRKLDQAVELVESGEYDGIVVWKFSRVARHRLRWAVALDRVESAGGVLISATEDFDVTTAAGRLGRGMSAEFNAFQADLIGEGWTEAHERRVRNGKPHSGRGHFGYVYDRDERLHVPDPETGPVLAEIYRRYVAGESCYALARWLNDHGHRTMVSGGPWSDRSLRRVLDDGFAAGFFNYRNQQHQGVHEPLIDFETWQAYQDARGARRRTPARTERSQYLLSGLVRCARCGGGMVANYVNPGTKLSRRAKGAAEGKRYSAGKPRMTYRCQWGKQSGQCIGGSINMTIVEAYVKAYVYELAGLVDQRAADRETDGVLDARRRLLMREEDRLDRERDKAKQALVQLALRDAERPMPREAYDAARTQLEEKVARLTEAIETAGRTHRRASTDVLRDASRLVDEWDELPVAQRREMLRRLIDCVLVRTGSREMRIVSIVEVRPEAF